jgi:hypothetical protein
MQSVERILWPQENFIELSDEFLVRGCRVRFRGGWITVDPISAGADAAAVLAAYADALKRHIGYMRLVTREEFASLPPGHTVDEKRMQLAPYDRGWQIAGARREIVAAAHPRLAQCYDYFQLANDSGNVLVNLYKMIETIEDEYGGERQAGHALGLANEMKQLKRWANDRSRDERHALALPRKAVTFTDSERAQARIAGRAILEKFAETFL